MGGLFFAIDLGCCVCKRIPAMSTQSNSEACRPSHSNLLSTYLDLQDHSGDVEARTDLLVREMRAKASHSHRNHNHGFRFLFGDEPAQSYKRYCPGVRNSAWVIAQSVKSYERVRVFRNALGEVAAEIVNPTSRSFQEWRRKGEIGRPPVS
jgi:hypothetical protein